MRTKSDSLPIRYGIAVLSIAVAVFVRILLDPALGDLFPFATLFFAVLVTTWYGGLGPGLLAIVLGAVSSVYFLIPPRGTFAVQGWDQQLGIVLYVSVSLGIALLGGAMRATQQRAERAGDAERTQREQLHVTLDSIGDAVIATNTEGKVTFLNPVAQSLTGWTQDEAQGQSVGTVFKIVNEKTRKSVENPVAKVLREGIIVGLANHTLLITRDGRERPIDDSAAPIKNEMGETVGVVLIFRDVTERRHWERLQQNLQAQLEQQVQERTLELRSSEERFRLLVEGSKDYAIFLLDQNGKIISWNPGAERIKQYRAEEIIGQHFSRFYSAEDVQSGKPEHELQVAAAEGRYEEEDWRFRKDGSQFWANVVITALRNESGNLRGFSKITRDITERKQAEENARRLLHEETARQAAEQYAQVIQDQREQLRVTLHSIGDAVITTDADGRVTFLNGVAEGLTGWASDEAHGKPLLEVFEIVNEHTRQPVENPALRAVREGVIVGLANHTVLIAKDGTERPIDDSAAPIRNARGGVFGSVLVFRDITERRRAEAAVRESEARNAAILQMALDCIITMDHEGKVVEFNPAAEKTFGYSREQVIGRELGDLIIPPPLRDRHRKGMAHYLATGEGPVLNKRIELPALRADGTEFPVELAIIRIPINGPPLFTAYLRDISERTGIERHRTVRLALTQVFAQAATVHEAATGLLRAICESLGWDVGLFWTLDQEADALRCLESWHITDLPIAEFEATSRGRTFRRGEGLPGRVWAAGKPAWILDVVKDANFPRATAAAKDGLHSGFACPIVVGETLGIIEFFSQRIQEPDAELLEIMDTVAGQIGQFMERKEAEDRLRQSEQELREADRRKDEFLATLAHELRNPLAPITNALEIMRMTAKEEEVGPLRDVMERQVEQMVHLVDDLLDVSRITSGKIVLRKERLDMSEIIQSAVETSRPIVESAKHDLTVTLPPQPLHVEGDKTRLAQVLSNLLTNAAKYTPEGGRIWLSVSHDAHNALIRVRDTGIGIPAEMMPLVFEMFTQVDRNLGRSQGGLGIGLTLVRTLVEMHGGTVEAHSDGPGQGSEFVVCLPLACEDPNRQRVEGDQSAEPALDNTSSHRRILVVDDNKDSAETLGKLLRIMGNEVREAYDGPSALEAAATFKPHVVLLDIGLPGISGYDVAHRMRQMPEVKDALLIAQSGWGQDEDKQRSAEAGFNAHMVKPVDASELRSLLAKLE